MMPDRADVATRAGDWRPLEVNALCWRAYTSLVVCCCWQCVHAILACLVKSTSVNTDSNLQAARKCMTMTVDMHIDQV